MVLGISSNYTYHSFKNKISAIETETLNKSLKLNGNIIRWNILSEFTTLIQKNSKRLSVCGKINVHTIAAQKYIAPQAA